MIGLRTRGAVTSAVVAWFVGAAAAPAPIEGKYIVSNADNGNFNDQLAVANVLIDRARRERAAASGKN